MTAELTKVDVAALREGLQYGRAPEDVFAAATGGRSTGGGFWRFFSPTFPDGGLQGWDHAEWRSYWPSLPSSVLFVGEDLFGNQIGVRRDRPQGDALIWSHENGDFWSLEMPIAALLEAVVEAGVEWLDFYSDGSPQVAAESGLTVGGGQQLHWIKPLILGGTVTRDNLTLVERHAHLIGHGKLWAQVGHLPPGTEVVGRRS
jgi:hypothetical protein